jgi:hypothetical protein
MPKDTQRSKIFRAEKQLPAGQLLSWPEVDGMVDTIQRSRWWGSRRPDLRKITVRHSQARICFSNCDWIAPGALSNTSIGAYGTNQWHVIHSLTHLLCPAGDHGPEFAMAYIKMTGRFFGKESELAVRDAFREERIRTYTHSPESKEAAKKKAAQVRFLSTIERARRLQAELEAED